MSDCSAALVRWLGLDTTQCCDNQNGINCEEKRIIKLTLPEHNITGPIPSDIKYLSNLQVL
ncbi:UNVERIFIED_CONTAM: hypothetical protein HDU68_003936 [Siphonaria sp. JEL0065]|nr:hypothetical protein HDU68_003936 [Siphonaria sp. JEL0065]